LGTDGWNVGFLKDIFGDAFDEDRFSNAGVPEKDDFEVGFGGHEDAIVDRKSGGKMFMEE
jgi:hypothetical protein